MFEENPCINGYNIKKKWFELTSEDPRTIIPIWKITVHAVRWLGYSWVMHMWGLCSFYISTHVLTLLNWLLSIFLGKLTNIWINHNYIWFLVNSINFISNIVQKQSTILKWFIKLLNNILLQKYNVSMRFEYDWKIETTTELSL